VLKGANCRRLQQGTDCLITVAHKLLLTTGYSVRTASCGRRCTMGCSTGTGPGRDWKAPATMREMLPRMSQPLERPSRPTRKA
jgi:hypothetical protein